MRPARPIIAFKIPERPGSFRTFCRPDRQPPDYRIQLPLTPTPQEALVFVGLAGGESH